MFWSSVNGIFWTIYSNASARYTTVNGIFWTIYSNASARYTTISVSSFPNACAESSRPRFWAECGFWISVK